MYNKFHLNPFCNAHIESKKFLFFNIWIQPTTAVSSFYLATSFLEMPLCDTLSAAANTYRMYMPRISSRNRDEEGLLLARASLCWLHRRWVIWLSYSIWDPKREKELTSTSARWSCSHLLVSNSAHTQVVVSINAETRLNFRERAYARIRVNS